MADGGRGGGRRGGWAPPRGGGYSGHVRRAPQTACGPGPRGVDAPARATFISGPRWPRTEHQYTTMRPMASSRKPRKLVFCWFFAFPAFGIDTSSISHMKCSPAGRNARRIPPGGPGGRRAAGLAQRAGGADGRPAAAAIPFSLTLPASPPGTGGGPNTKPAAQRPTTCFLAGPRAPPMSHWGRSGPAGGHDARPARPGRPGPSTADLAAGMTRTRGGPAAGAGRHRNGRARGSPRAVARPISGVRPRQRVFSPSKR